MICTGCSHGRCSPSRIHLFLRILPFLLFFGDVVFIWYRQVDENLSDALTVSYTSPAEVLF